MRLININTLEFEEHFDANIPPYAILSHRWSDDEITFADYRKGRRKESKGYQRVLRFCEIAKHYNAWLEDASHATNASMSRHFPGASKHESSVTDCPVGLHALDIRSKLHHVWIDTCCIDKRSSAELSEAINAMYKWYQKAEVCFAHLADVAGPGEDGTDHSEKQIHRSWQGSQWFTRGWTLQEMLAPRFVLFCSADWAIIGHKCSGDTYPWLQRKSNYKPEKCCFYLPSSPHLNSELAAFCRIDQAHLDEIRSMNLPSAAQVLSWASKRETSRIEDAAYSLFGLLSINLPLLYGEGANAFRRLLIEIISTTNDDTVFAHSHPLTFFGDSLKDYSSANEVIRSWRSVEPACVFQHGRVEISSILIPLTRSKREHAWLIPLHCGTKGGAHWNGIFALLVEECFDMNGSRFFRRLRPPHQQTEIAGYIVAMPGRPDIDSRNDPFWRTRSRLDLLWLSIKTRSLGPFVNGRFARQTLVLRDSRFLETRGKFVYHAGEMGRVNTLNQPSI